MRVRAGVGGEHSPLPPTDLLAALIAEGLKLILEKLQVFVMLRPLVALCEVYGSGEEEGVGSGGSEKLGRISERRDD